MILATICMRGGSKGVPNKNSKMLLNKPLMNYTFDCVKEVSSIDDIVVSSDSKKILQMSSSQGIKNLYTRDEELSSDSSSKWDVFKDIILKYEKEYNITVDYLVDLDVTVPRRKPEHVQKAIELMLKEKIDVVITGYEPERNPYFNMMEINKSNNLAEIVKKSNTPIVCRQDAPQVYGLSPAVYVVSREALFKFDHWSNAKCLISPIDREYGLDIDTQFDFDFIEYLLKREKNEK
ncbi:acylneuraminate cytidylyltransferase family protein [Malaciobacter mytili]|uniref:acylneuraminate cytidylyltransferase family protein n=1 Tax=Malaciobacter mytili TaxID=603050 RepID=UPI003BB0722E